MTNKSVYTVGEIKNIMGIGLNQAYALVKTEGFPSVRVGKRIVIPKEAFNVWLNNRKGCEG